jgi:NitT/TauT family transport system permease protein
MLNSKIGRRASQIALGMGCLFFWQLLSSLGWIDRFFFSSPIRIIEELIHLGGSAATWSHLGVTLTEASLSFIVGAVTGATLGFAIAQSSRLAELVIPYFRLLNAVPRFVLAPIFFLWFGLGIGSKVALGVTMVFFIVFFNTYQGVCEVPQILINNIRMLGASRWQVSRYVLFPSALGWIFSSLHTSIGFAIIAAVVGEYLGSSEGIGYLIAQAEGIYDTARVFAGIFILSGMALVITAVVIRVERKFQSWKIQSDQWSNGNRPSI